MSETTNAANADRESKRAKSQQAFTLRLADEFDAHAKVYKDNRLWRRIALALAILVLFLILVNVAIILQEPRVLQRPLRLGERPVFIKAGRDAPITTRDLENFFYYTLKLRYGWDSQHIYAAWNELSELSVREFQLVLNAEASKQVPHPKTTNLQVHAIDAFKAANMTNEISLDRDSIVCGAGEPVKDIIQYYCRGFGAIIATMYDAKGDPGVPIRKEVEFEARFQPAIIELTEPRIWDFSVTHMLAKVRSEDE
ncbi:MAG: hypothetical protein AAFQ77_03140 [Myxococcota bacterium]